MDKSLRQAYDYWQDQPDNSHVQHRAFVFWITKVESRGAPGVWVQQRLPARSRSATERPVFYSLPRRIPGNLFLCFEKQQLTNARVSQLSTTSRQQSVPAVVWTLGSHRALNEAALMLLPFRSTDPKQCVNPQSRLPQPQTGRASF